MKAIRPRRWLSALFVCAFGCRAFAGALDNLEVNPALLTLFGPNENFRCQVDLRKHGASNAPIETVTFELVRQHDQTSLDFDVDRLQNSPLPAVVVDQFKRIGVKHVLALIQFGRPALTVSFPSLRSYVESPVYLTDTGAKTKKGNVRVFHGIETVSGHKCRHYTRGIPDAGGQTLLFETWEAVDIRGFPLLVQQTNPGEVLDFTFSHVLLGAVKPAEFTVPADFDRYDSIESLLLSKIVSFGLGR